MIRLVLFDIDSTLTHTNHVGINAFGKTLEAAFQITDGVKGLNFAGRTDTGIVREIFGRFSIEPSRENFEKFFHAYPKFLSQMIPHCGGVVADGAEQLIRDLKALPKPPMIGLLTGNIRRGAEIKLAHFNLWEHFELGGFAEDSEHRNEIAIAALSRGRHALGNHLRGEEVVVIGDTPHDVACGHHIGAKVLAVATGSSTMEELSALNPAWTVADLTHISAAKLCGV